MIFSENHKKEQREKLGKNGPLRHSEGHPRRGENKGCLAAAKGCLTAARLKGQKRPPRVPQGVALLCRGEVLHHDEGTVHKGKNFWIFVPKASYSYIDSLRTLINY